MSRRGVFFLTVSIAAAVILQSAALPIFVASYFKPDLLLIIMVFLALRGSYHTGTPLSWLLGLLKDVFSGLFLGLNALSFLIIFLIIKGVADRLYAESGFLFIVTVCTASLACVTVNLVLVVMFTNPSGITYSMLGGLLPHILINAFCASLVTLIPGFSRDGEPA